MTEQDTSEANLSAAAPADDGMSAPVNGTGLPADEVARMTDEIIAALDMTLTTPNCPSAAELPTMVENAVASVPGVGEVAVNVVWDPPWDQSRMSDEARVALNMW